jgi:hypothetical protein
MSNGARRAQAFEPSEDERKRILEALAAGPKTTEQLAIEGGVGKLQVAVGKLQALWEAKAIAWSWEALCWRLPTT